MLRKTCWLILLIIGVLLFGTVGYAPGQIGGGFPTILDHSIDQTGKAVNFTVYADTGIASGWVVAHNTGTGQDVQVNGTASMIPNSINYQITVNYSSLAQGTWQFTLWARDNVGYTTSLTIETVTIGNQTPPQILNYSVDQTGKTINFVVNDAGGIASGWVVGHNTGTGQDVQINGTVSPIMMDGGPPVTTRYLVSVYYATITHAHGPVQVLPEGNWQFTLWAQDNFGNTISLPIETVTIDQTPPQITFYNGTSALTDHAAVTDLSQVKIVVTDNVDPNPQIMNISLSNGAPQLGPSHIVTLSYNVQGGAIMPAFPPLPPSSPGAEYAIKMTAQDATGNVATQSVYFTYAPPLPTIDSWQANRSDTGLSNPTSGNLGLWQFNTAVTITQIRVAVQPRSYNQVFVDPLSGSCTIPAGQTGCTLNTNIGASAGTMKWYQSNCYVQSQDGILTSSTKSTSFQWDLIPPSILDHSFDQPNKTLNFVVNEPQTGDFGGAVGLASGWAVAHNTSTGQDVQLNGTAGIIPMDGGSGVSSRYLVAVNYGTLAEGTWQFTLWARDNFGNTSSLAAETVTIDQTPPQITFYNGTSALTDHAAVTDLSQVKMTVTDNVDPNPQIMNISLSNGAPQLGPSHIVTLSYNVQGGAIMPAFPPLPPSSPGAEYAIKMTAQDATGNVATKSVYFTYAPQQAGLPSLSLPALAANVVHADGSNPISVPVPVSQDGKTLISGVGNLLLMSAPSSTTTVTIQGQTLAPGDQKLLPSYSFTATNGKLDLSVRGDQPGQVNLQVASDAPNAPAWSGQITFYQPTITLLADPGWGVQPYIQTQKIGPKTVNAPYQATLDPKKAQAADPITSPLFLLEFTQKPAAYQVSGDLLQGVLVDTDPLELDYQLSMYNGGQKYVLGTGSQTLVKLPITDVSVKLAATPGVQVTRKIQKLQVAVQSDGAITCKPTSSLLMAQKYGATGPVCYLRWTQTANGLQATADGTGLSGALQDPGDQSLALTVDLYTPYGTVQNVFSRSLTVTGSNPNPLAIDVVSEGYGQKLADGNYITSELVQGQFGRVHLTASTMGNIVLEVNSADGVKSYAYVNDNQTTTYSQFLTAGALTAWQTKAISLKGYYKDMPDVSTTMNLNVTGVPSQQVQARLQQTQPATDATGVPVKLQVGRPGHGNDINYAPEQDGAWEARFGVIDKKQQFNPVTDYQDVTGGALETALGGFTPGSAQLAAQVRLKPPDSSINYNRQINSNTFNVFVFPGAAPQAKLICKNPSGPAPLATGIILQMDQTSSQVLGEVGWEISSDQGSSWQTANAGTHRDATFKVASGQYQVRARVVNSITNQAGYTDPVQLTAYRVPQLVVTGAKTVFQGTPVNLTAQVQVDGQPVPDGQAVVEWYTSRGDKVQDGPSLSLTASTAQSLIYRVRARMSEAPASDAAAWISVDTVVKGIAPRPVCATLQIPNYMEYNTVSAQNYTLTAIPALPVGMDKNQLALQSEWHLPDGQVVSGLTANYTPTAQDASNKQATVKFVTWIDGNQAQTSATYQRTMPVRSYTWPDFNIDIKESPPMAPSSVVLTAQSVGIESYKLEKPACQWLLPADAQKLRDLDSGSCSIMVSFPNPGDYPVSMQITDARGNTAQAAATVSLPEAPGCQVAFNPTFSNAKMRELLDVIPHPTSKCGHPQDSLVQWQFTVDDPQAQIIGTDQNALIKGLHAGSWTIHLHAESKLGKTVDLDYPITVITHQPPTCTIKTYDSAAGRLFNAGCTDPDGGRIVAYRWYLDDKVVSQANAMQIKPGTSGVLRFEAENDAGGKYDQVLNTP